MDEKKICTNPKCLWGGEELPLTKEFFNKNSNKKDGFEGQCKKCRKTYMEDYRAGKRVRSKSNKPAAEAKAKKKTVGDGSKPSRIKSSGESLRSASPAEIVIALRKGMATEIVALIREKYDL